LFGGWGLKVASFVDFNLRNDAFDVRLDPGFLCHIHVAFDAIDQGGAKDGDDRNHA
jgi:hypothetical protein